MLNFPASLRSEQGKSMAAQFRAQSSETGAGKYRALSAICHAHHTLNMAEDPLGIPPVAGLRRKVTY